MAYQTATGVITGFPWSILVTTDTLDADGEKLAFLFRAPKAGILNTVAFHTGTVTAGDTVRVSFQDVDAADGDPDEVQDQYYDIEIADGDDDTWKTTGKLTNDGSAEGTPRTVTLNQLIAVVFEYEGYIDGNMDIDFLYTHYQTGAINGQAYISHKVGTWGKNVYAMPLMAVTYSDGSYAYLPAVCPGYPGEVALSTGTEPDEVAHKFSFPFAAKVRGAWVACESDGEANVILYDTDGTTALETVTINPAIRNTLANTAIYVYFSQERILTAGASYYLALKPTTATAINANILTFPAAGARAQWHGGTDVCYSYQTDALGWADDTTKQLVAGLDISALDDGVGGGGMLVHPGTSGGARA